LYRRTLRPQNSTLFPYTTLFRSQGDSHQIEIRPQGDDYLGHITAEISETTANDGAGFVTWRYHVSDAELNPLAEGETREEEFQIDRKSTRLNSSHVKISYAVFCL